MKYDRGALMPQMSLGRKALLATMVVAACGAAALLVFLPRHTAPAEYQIDIERLPALKDSLGATFAVETKPTQTVTQANVDKLTAAIKTLTVTPPECLNTAAANFGQTVGNRGDVTVGRKQTIRCGHHGGRIPAPFVTSAPIDACRTSTWSGPTALFPEHAHRRAAGHRCDDECDPLRFQTGGLAGDRVVDQYEYIALLDDRHMVTLTSFAEPHRHEGGWRAGATAAVRCGRRGAMALGEIT